MAEVKVTRGEPMFNLVLNLDEVLTVAKVLGMCTGEHSYGIYQKLMKLDEIEKNYWNITADVKSLGDGSNGTIKIKLNR